MTLVVEFLWKYNAASRQQEDGKGRSSFKFFDGPVADPQYGCYKRSTLLLFVVGMRDETTISYYKWVPDGLIPWMAKSISVAAKKLVQRRTAITLLFPTPAKNCIEPRTYQYIFPTWFTNYVTT